MKIRAFILIVAAAFMLSSCGKAPESDIVQTNPENDIPAVTTTVTEESEQTEASTTPEVTEVEQTEASTASKVTTVEQTEASTTPESTKVQTDAPVATTTEESTADNITTIDEGEDIDFFDDGEAIATSPTSQNTRADEPTDTPESIVTTAKKTDPSEDVLQFEAVYNPESRNIDISVTNNGETILYYGAEYEIEVLKGDCWEFYYSPEAYDDWLGEVYPGETGRDTIGFIEADYLPAGTYRILKEINGADRYSNEFVVE